jgi:23S rRNA (uracil1939-C5)-methyltransferase
MGHPNAKPEVMLEIAALCHGPYGVGRHDGKVVLVPAAVPGDHVTVRLQESKKNYAGAELVSINEPSAHRREPPCPYVRACGGCPWQQVDYQAQLAAKKHNVEDALRRIGNIGDCEILPIIPAPQEFHYRRRIRLRCNRDRQLGFFRSRSHQLVEIDHCEIAAPRVNTAVGRVRRWLETSNGVFSALEIVAGDGEHEIVLIATAGGSPRPRNSAQLAELLNGSGSLSGVILVIGEHRQIWGNPSISINTEGDLRLVVEADVFTQVNPDGNRAILQQLLRAGEFTRPDRVLELYSGAGNFTLSIARRAGEVLAMEGHALAVQSGKLNAQRYGIENIHWRAEAVPAGLAKLAHHRERFNKIVLDPPRSGAKGLGASLARLQGETIFYISCDPATLARDLGDLTKHGYRVATVQPIDLFPQTFHVEALAVVKRQ